MKWRTEKKITDQEEAAGSGEILPGGGGGAGRGGFSLVELMVSLAVSSLVTCLLLSLFIGFQGMSAEIAATLDTRDTLRLAPLMVGRWVKGAGMNLPRIPDEYLEVNEETIGVRADLSGNDGNPDGDTDDSFEDISIKVIRNELKLKSGNGTYQPVLKYLESMAVEQDGNLLLRLHLEGRKNLLDTEETCGVEASFYLWNPRKNLLPEVIP